MLAGHSCTGWRMILSEKSATFRDHAVCAAHGAQSWFRANLSAASTRRCHQISFLSALVRIAGIEPPSSEWRSEAQPIDQIRMSASFGGKRMELNLLHKGTAFTARRRRQPVLIGTSRYQGSVIGDQ